MCSFSHFLIVHMVRMEEYVYPIVVEGDWSPEQAKRLKNKLQIYFQSKNKSNGGDCVIQFNEQSGAVTVLFKTSEIRDSVLSKADHVITTENVSVKLKVSNPEDTDNSVELTMQASENQQPNQNVPPGACEPDLKSAQESFAIVLENVSDEANTNVLALLVENVSSVPEKDFSMELIPEINTAVVTFNSPNAVGKFLEESKTHKKFQDYGLKAHALERSTCVRVENLPADGNNKMLIEQYFEKWGGPVEETIIVPLEQAAIITFKNEEDKDKLLKMEHNIFNVPVKIYPYYKSLDTALYGNNRPELKLPEPLKVNVHPAIRRFFLKQGLISSISGKMGLQFCQINMDQPEVVLSPDPALLKQKVITRQHINGWAKNASEAFKDIISNYTTFELQVLQPLGYKVKSDVKGLVNDLLFIDMDASDGVLTLAGATHDINDLKCLVEKMIEQASTQMEREKNSVTETMEMTPVMYSLLLQDGLQSAITASPQLHLDYNKKMNKLQLSGLKTEVLAFKKLILEKKLSMKDKPLKVDRSLLDFLRSVDNDEMSKDLFISHGICAVYTVENLNLVLIGSTEQALSEAEKRFNMVLQCNDIIVEDPAVLALPKWRDLHKQLQSSYNTPNKRINVSPQTDKVIVSGFREPVTEVSHSLGDFIKKHTRIEDAVIVKSHAVIEFIKDRKSHDWQHFMKSGEVTVCFYSKRPKIKLSGERRFVKPAMIFFKKMSDALFADTLIIKKAGAKKYFKDEGRYMLSFVLKEKGFVVVLQEDHMLEEEEDDEHKDRGLTNELMFRDTSESPRNEEFVMVKEIESAVFQLCGETQHDVNEAKDMINSLILKEYADISIRDLAISHFTKEDAEMLNAMQRKLSVSIKLERKDQDPVITLEGLTKDVHAAESRIRDMIRRVERHESKRREAFMVSSMVEWKYQDRGQNLKSFDMMTNYDLEKAFQKKKTLLKIKIDNDEYSVDFVRLQATRGSWCFELQRKDLTDVQYSLPPHWEDMKGQTVVLVKLKEGSKEYGEVETEFTRTGLTLKIIQIERVQNSTLWKNYMVKMEELESKNKHTNNEKLLFHGTGPDKTDQINHQGFNRSYAGMHGSMYGNGSYFAVDPGYSAQGYSKPDAKGHKRMYLARVLVGDFTQGRQGIIGPPAKNSNSADLYNSVTDNPNSPSMFVIFNDVQAYPEYIITFQ